MAEHGHGHSFAAWVAVTTIIVGTGLVSLAVIVQSIVLAVIGLVVCVIGVVAGKVLAMAGFGQDKPDQAHGTTAIR